MYIYIYICIYIYIYIDLEHFGFDMGASENRVYPSKVILMINGDEDLAVLEVPPQEGLPNWLDPTVLHGSSICYGSNFKMQRKPQISKIFESFFEE